MNQRGPGRRNHAVSDRLDPRTFGRAPAAVFLADLLNAGLDENKPLWPFIKRFGALMETNNTFVKRLSVIGERGFLDDVRGVASPCFHLRRMLELHRADIVTQLSSQTDAISAYDPRYRTLMYNVLLAPIKTLRRRIVKFSTALLRQQELAKRLAAGKADAYEEYYTKDGTVLIYDGQELVKLTLRDFPSDQLLVEDELWRDAKFTAGLQPAAEVV